MKKYKAYIILIIISLLILTGCSLSPEQLEDTTRPGEPVITEPTSYVPQGVELVNEEYNIYIDGYVDMFYIEQAIEEIKNAPLYDNSYNIILTDYYLDGTDLENNKQVLAQAHHYIKTIYIHQFAIKGSLLHEIGHIVERTYNLSETEEFLELYNKVAHTGEITNNDEYHRSNAREYFAESYKNYVKGILIYGDVYDYFQELLCSLS